MNSIVVAINEPGESKMKVLMVNGSPHPQGNTSLALAEMRKVFEAQGVEVELSGSSFLQYRLR